MNTKEEFRKYYTLLIESYNAEKELNKIGIYVDESIFINSAYGMFEIAVEYLLNKEGLEILYESLLFQDITIEEVMSILDEFFL